MLAHIAFWDRRAAFLLDRWISQGILPSEAEVDVVNAAMLPQWRLLPPRPAVEDALAAADEIDAKVARLSDAQLAAIGEGVKIRLDRSHHRSAHLDELERRFP